MCCATKTCAEVRNPTSESEAWARCIDELSPRIFSYLRRLPCSHEERKTIWADVIGSLVLLRIDLPSIERQWESVLPVLRAECSRYSRYWRRERCRADPNGEVRSADDDDDLITELKIKSLPLFVEQLPRLQRNAIKRRFLEQKSYKQIAFELGTSPASARASVCIGLARLRRVMRSKLGTSEAGTGD